MTTSQTSALKPGRALPALSADLLLLHPPAFFEFRDRRDIYFPILGTSGDVPITPLYEYFPIGFKTLQRYLSERGHVVRILNLSSVLLRYPELNVDHIIDSLDVRLVGLDLHWMVHVQGCLAVAQMIKARRPDLPVLLGGLTSSYAADELIKYPFIDMVMRGYDTHLPMARLMRAVKVHGPLDMVPNLLWKDSAGTVRDNGTAYMPSPYGCGVDWSGLVQRVRNESLPILEFVSTQNAGCSYHCGWCGGSREAFKRVFNKQAGLVRKLSAETRFEFGTLAAVEARNQYHFYSIGSYNEGRTGLGELIRMVGKAGLKSVSYEQFHLTPNPILRQMAQANEWTTLTLSPDSHDPAIAKAAGRGVYTNEELEAWIERALGYGIHQIDLWYLVGMPGQDAESVFETVDYAHHLLRKFQGARVNPMICPMIPFLDPGSTFFEHPHRHGYRVFYRTVEEHRQGMKRASIINRINYETRWLSRADLVRVGFKAVLKLMEAKLATGFLTGHALRRYNADIEDALEFVEIVHEVDNIADHKARARELDKIGNEILARNNKIFFSGVANQAFPMNRQIGNRWFDEFGWEPDLLDQFVKA